MDTSAKLAMYRLAVDNCPQGRTTFIPTPNGICLFGELARAVRYGTFTCTEDRWVGRGELLGWDDQVGRGHFIYPASAVPAAGSL
jgi:hypothetical protein